MVDAFLFTHAWRKQEIRPVQYCRKMIVKQFKCASFAYITMLSLHFPFKNPNIYVLASFSELNVWHSRK